MKLEFSWVRALLFVGLLAAFVSVRGSTADVRITNAWASPTPPGITVGGVFMTFVADATDRLLSTSSAVAERVELHSMNMEGGMMHMRPLAVLDLPAGKRVELSPSGTHFMLIGLKQPLKADSSFQMQLRFERAGERSVTVMVRPLAK